jgi:diguanylate cyclase (GGDEF)-like protein/PAS domain S-box-containing protein
MHMVLRRYLQSFHLGIKQLFGRYNNLNHFLSASPCVVYALNPTTFKPTYISANAENFYAVKPEEILAEDNWWKKRLHPDDRDEVLQRFKAWVVSGCCKQLEYTYRIRRNCNSWIWVHDQLTAVRNQKNGALLDIVGTHIDITKQKQKEQQLQELMSYDSLTGLPNRNRLKELLMESMHRTCESSTLMALLCIDLDDFKGINDHFGREAGDAFLCETSTRLQTMLHENDAIARAGGDEFIVILEQLSNDDEYIHRLDRIQDVVAEPFNWRGHNLHISFSTGITLYPQDEEHNAGRLLRQANYAMYKAKLKGKKGRYLFSVAKQKQEKNHIRKLTRIDQAIRNGEMELYYQPKVNIRTESIIGVEALVRWNHPESGLQSPAAFLPAIQNHPLDIELGRWVINTALQQIEAWKRENISLSVSVNVSGYHLQQAGFMDELKQIMANYPLVKDGDLIIEILETTAIKDIKRVSGVINECRAIGVNVALDDFGTGYSSLSYLKNLPVQTLKIDRSFVNEICEKPDDLAIIEGILGMAKAFGREVIAEGIETVEQGQILLQLNCEQVQGYCIAHPMPSAGIPAWMSTWKADISWKNTPVLSETEYQFLRISLAHREWVKKIESYVRGLTPALPEMDPARCTVGLWLNTDSAFELLGKTKASRIALKHDKIHSVALNILKSHEQQHPDMVDKHLDELRICSDNLTTGFLSKNIYSGNR